jgi:DNA recombination protein RmuC
MSEITWGLAGLLIGAGMGFGAGWALAGWRRRREGDLAQRLWDQSRKDRTEEIGALIGQLRTEFAALSREALSANTDDFLKVARTKLDEHAVRGEEAIESKKKLIDARLEEMGLKLAEVNRMLQQTEKQGAELRGAFTSYLERATQATNRLHDTTAQLKEALANPQRRGQWGERMAEDVLRLAGMIENVNYQRQVSTDRGRPDFTFLLPRNQVVHMDVKFPLTNYLKALEAPDDPSRTAATEMFLKDVRNHLKQLKDRAYTDPSTGSLDFVLVFIPNEQIYGFIHEKEPKLLDAAMKAKLVLCSPLTLYAVLAVLRQALDAFRVENASRQIFELLAAFKDEWDKFSEGMAEMGRKIEQAEEEYRKLIGVRTKKLDRQLEQIEIVRAARVAPGEGLFDQPVLSAETRS